MRDFLRIQNIPRGHWDKDHSQAILRVQRASSSKCTSMIVNEKMDAQHQDNLHLLRNASKSLLRIGITAAYQAGQLPTKFGGYPRSGQNLRSKWFFQRGEQRPRAIIWHKWDLGPKSSKDKFPIQVTLITIEAWQIWIKNFIEFQQYSKPSQQRFLWLIFLCLFFG